MRQLYNNYGCVALFLGVVVLPLGVYLIDAIGRPLLKLMTPFLLPR